MVEYELGQSRTTVMITQMLMCLDLPGWQTRMVGGAPLPSLCAMPVVLAPHPGTAGMDCNARSSRSERSGLLGIALAWVLHK